MRLYTTVSAGSMKLEVIVFTITSSLKAVSPINAKILWAEFGFYRHDADIFEQN
jgi:hypothetical protein